MKIKVQQTLFVLSILSLVAAIVAAVFVIKGSANTSSPQSLMEGQRPQADVSTPAGNEIKPSKLEADAGRLMSVFSSTGIDRFQKKAHIDPKVREITPVDDIVRIEMTGTVKELDNNYYSAPGKIFLSGGVNPIAGTLFFTYIEGTLVLTSDRSLE